MRTKQKFPKDTTVVVCGDIISPSDSNDMKTRKSLHPIQEAAGDKENLVGPGRMPPSGKTPQKLLINVVSSAATSKTSKVEKKKPAKIEKKITAEDLTSQAGPSEHYWELLAERRRVALEKALEENRELHERVSELEEENRTCNQLLEECRALIDTMNEVLDANEGDQSIAEDNSISEHERPCNQQ